MDDDDYYGFDAATGRLLTVEEAARHTGWIIQRGVVEFSAAAPAHPTRVGLAALVVRGETVDTFTDPHHIRKWQIDERIAASRRVGRRPLP